MTAEDSPPPRSGDVSGEGSAVAVFRAALKLGLTSFGGPAAHLGYFRSEYVRRRRWLSDQAYAEVVAISQVLPGPASSQAGALIGLLRAGWRGALAAWVGFTLPSALLMVGFATFVGSVGDVDDAVWLRALKLVAVAVVLDAVLGMGRRLASTARTAAIAVAVFVAVVIAPTPYTQIAALAIAGVLGVLLHRWFPAPELAAGLEALPVAVSRRVGVSALAFFGVVLLGLPFLPHLGALGELAAATYRAGALVFGGGHVVLPLLESGTVPGLVTSSEFLAGYGFAQALPGPLFAFGTYLGQVAAGALGALVATVFVFLPGFLLLFGVLPFWQQVRGNTQVRAALGAVNAAVVGILGAALWDPIITSGVRGGRDAFYAAVLFAALRLGKAPPWVIVVGAVLASPLLDG
jgi:chromate transporter